MLLPAGVLSHSLFTRLIPAGALLWANPVLLYICRAAGLLKSDGISIERRFLAHSLFTRLILSSRLIAPYSCARKKPSFEEKTRVSRRMILLEMTFQTGLKS